MKYLEEHKKLLRENAADCVVVLKKDGNFPLEKPCKIALYGNGARRTQKGGTGSGDVYCLQYNNCETALENCGFTVTTKDWLDFYDKECENSHADWVQSIIKRAETNKSSLFVEAFGAVEKEHEYDILLNGEGEACVYVLARTSGEGNDRKFEKGDVLLTDTEVRDILFLNNKFEKFMLVINVGGVVDLSPVLGVKNILLLSQLGVVTGDVFSDILLGRVSPSGKLATTWAKYSDYQTIGEFGNRDDTRYKEGVYVGYRYFDSANVQPLYPFGYGLSYTEFNAEIISVQNEKSKITVTVQVKNVGKREGKETIQLYVTPPKGRIDKPYQGLVAFAKTKLLRAEETQTLNISFDLADVASYDEADAQFILEAGKYVLRAGNSSRNTRIAAVIALADTVITERVKNALGKPDFSDAVLEYHCENDISAAKVIKLSAKDFDCITHSYKTDEHINEKMKSLSVETLMHLCIGAYLPDSKLSVIGGSACHVCGAAGETSNYAYDVTNGKYLVFADGPAGLRISPEYIKEGETMRGIHRKVEGLMEFISKEQQDYLLSVGNGAKPEDIILQATTAIPISTAIAQSWNPEFARLCGDIVGAECEIYHCDYWLAPAVNLHRSILCGRTFEYYSEDPVITGKIAAGVVRGLQSHKGIGATVKHFCANNQEANRYNNNSIVSERAMRELYLKGFRICIAESSPKAVMTSYNLLNGIHTSERKDLIEGILRGEWGFKGLVITDWITSGQIFDARSKHEGVYAHNILNAGGDLMMPGNRDDLNDLSQAYTAGTISRERLEICAGRVYEEIMRR